MHLLSFLHLIGGVKKHEDTFIASRLGLLEPLQDVGREIDGSNWLEADLRISCDDDTYRSYTFVGGIAMVIYPFGIPPFLVRTAV